MTQQDALLTSIVPSERQMLIQQMEFYGFIHFGVNTFTNKEWGDGRESPSIFNPVDLDVRQWVDAFKSAHLKGLILTCKHHDGFCLWPSAHTTHTIAYSPYKDGKGDIVKDLSLACKEAGLKFGVYLSPWDQNHSTYGQGKAYDDFFIAQLTELLTNYGEVFTVWFDGACGEGLNGKVQRYNWTRYNELVRTLQPHACINICGPDVRWCGNERGDTRLSEWSVVSRKVCESEFVASCSQQSDDTSFRSQKIPETTRDLGSHKALQAEKDLIWYPCEVDISIRPGWFYHESEDNSLMTINQFKELYLSSVGGNTTLLINVPPMPSGLIHQNDLKLLAQMGDFIASAFKHNLLSDAVLACPDSAEGHGIENVRSDDYASYFKSTGTTTRITLSWNKDLVVKYLVLKEHILTSQRVERFVLKDESGEILYEGTTIGYKKIIPFPAITTRQLVIEILDSRIFATLSFIAVY